MLSKKRTKVINSLNVNENSKNDSNKQPVDLQASSNAGNYYIQDLAIIEELIGNNQLLTNNLHHNSNVIYSLLYHKNIFLQYRDHPSFHDVIQNKDTVSA